MDILFDAHVLHRAFSRLGMSFSCATVRLSEILIYFCFIHVCGVAAGAMSALLAIPDFTHQNEHAAMTLLAQAADIVRTLDLDAAMNRLAQVSTRCALS